MYEQGAPVGFTDWHRGDELQLEIVVGHREQRGNVHVQLLIHGLGFRVEFWVLGFGF